MKYADCCCTTSGRLMSLSHPIVRHKWQRGGAVGAALKLNYYGMNYLEAASVNSHLAVARERQPEDSYVLIQQRFNSRFVNNKGPMTVEPRCTNTLPIMRELLPLSKPWLKSSGIHIQYLWSARADELSNITSSVATFEAATLSVQVKSSTPQAFKTTLSVIFTRDCQSPTHRESNMERQFCERLSMWIIIVRDYLDFKQLGVELKYAVIQPPTVKNSKVIIILKEMKVKKKPATMFDLFPIYLTEIKDKQNCGRQWNLHTSTSTTAHHSGNIHYVQHRISLRCHSGDYCSRCCYSGCFGSANLLLYCTAAPISAAE